MTYVTFDINIVDQRNEPVEGVHAVLLSTDLRTRYLEGTSDADGTVQGLVPDGTYELRLFRSDARTGVFRVVVEDTLDPQAVTVEIDLWSPEDAADPALCRIYELFAGMNGPVDGQVFLSLTEQVVIREGTTFLPSMAYGLIQRGRFAAEVPRNAKVLAGIPGSHARVEFTVPDRPSARLTDLMFPYAVSFVPEQPPPSTLAINDAFDMLFITNLSDTRVVPLNEVPGVWSIAEGSEEGLRLDPLATGIRVTALASGTYRVVYTPYPAFTPFPDTPAVRRQSLPVAEFTVVVP